MATSSTTVDLSGFTTDAKFRAWGSAASAALAAAGLTRAADTGQIDWPTVTKPTTTNTKAGYEIWEFNDSLQPTRPIVIRVDYGSNSIASGNGPTTWLTVGTASDGAGAVSGVGMAVVQAGGPSSPTAANTSSMVGAAYSTSAGALTFFAGLQYSPGSPYHGGLWCVSRTCDSSGAPTGDGVVTYKHTSSTNANASIVCASYNPALNFNSRNVGSGSLAPSASISSGDTLQLYRNYAIIPTAAPILGAVSYYSTDIANYTTFAAAPFGSTSHTYIALGGTTNSNGHDAAASTNMCGAYIWE